MFKKITKLCTSTNNITLLYFTQSGTLQIHNAVYIPLDDDKSGLCIFINTATCQLLILCKCCLLFLVAGSPEVRDL